MRQPDPFTQVFAEAFTLAAAAADDRPLISRVARRRRRHHVLKMLIIWVPIALTTITVLTAVALVA